MLPAAEPMKKILLASSSRTLLERNHNLLMRRGFQLFTASSGREACQYHREQRLDLIIADMQLGDMGGDVFCSRVREEGNSRDVAVIIVCHDLPDHLQRVAQSSADAMLLRPISPIQLMETVGKFLDMEMVRSKRVDFCVEVQVADRTEGREFACLSRDISKSGIRLECGSVLETGRRIVCRFSIPQLGPVDAEGQVVRHVRTGDGRNQYGVQFVDLSSASRRQIEEHVTRIIG